MRWSRPIVANLVVVAALMAATPGSGDDSRVRRPSGRRAPGPWLTEVGKLVASDCESNDNFGLLFGSPAAIDGDTAVIGAYRDENVAGSEAGSAYLFTRTDGSWSEQQKVIGSDTQAGDWFGGRALVDGDTVFISAIGNDDSSTPDAGAVYVFNLVGDTLVEHQKLVSDNPEQGAYFGWGMAVDGDTLVVTSSTWWTSSLPGAAHVFIRSGDTWALQQELVPSDVVDGDVFGQSVAISGDMVVIGAPKNTHSGCDDAGAAYVFTRSGSAWTELQKITSSEPESSEQFGTFVSMSGETLMVSAQLDDSPTLPDTGSVYVFTWSGADWQEQQTLTASDGAPGDWFGDSVVVNGNTAIVSAIHHDLPSLPDAGAVYVFSRTNDTWLEREKVTASDAAAGDNFGWGLPWSKDTVMVGSPLDDHSSLIDAGSVYVFTLALFADDFESGSTSSWSVTVPAPRL